MYNQDIPWDDYEVIAVDDCSPDNSAELVEAMREKYSTLRVLYHKENKRVGGARNTGLEAAVGNYVWFIDPDDFIIPNCLKALLEDAEDNDVDVLQFDYRAAYEDGHFDIPERYVDDNVYTGEKFILDTAHGPWWQRCPESWRKLHRTKMMMDGGYRSVEHWMYEDTELTLFMFPGCKRVKHHAESVYCYHVNPVSITRARFTPYVVMSMVMQIERCVNAYEIAPSDAYRNLVKTHIQSTLSQYRKNILPFTKKEQWQYFRLMRKQNISRLRPFCTWRTYLAIKFGIKSFIR